MPRTINYTGRQKIKQSRVDMLVYEESGCRYFDLVSIDLEGMNIHDDAKIYIEPFFKSSFKRFYFGTVGNIVQPEDKSLEELPDSGIIHFRIKITDESGKHGMLLAFARRIAPRGLEEVTAARRCILPVNPVDTGPSVWRLSFNPDYGRPTLEISNKLHNYNIDYREVVRSPQFLTLVYPAVVKEIAHKIAFFEDDYEVDGDQWQSLWLRFFYKNLRVDEKPRRTEDIEDELENWVDAVEKGFCRKLKVQQKFIEGGVTG